MHWVSINASLFVFMARGKKLTYDEICSEVWMPRNKYVLTATRRILGCAFQAC